MSFRIYTNLISQASKNAAMGILTVGLLLIGFGVLIIAFSEIFAFLAAAIFFIVGIGCGVTAIKIFLAQRKIDKINNDDSQLYRENAHIHIEEHCDR
jgi:phage-related minor tail protein